MQSLNTIIESQILYLFLFIDQFEQISKIIYY